MHGYDNSTYSCDDIAADINTTVINIEDWNSWVGSDCTTGLYANLSYYDERAVCIGVNSTQPTSPASIGPSGSPSASAVTSTITAPSTTLTVATTMAPIPSGTVSDCEQYYTVESGDSCAAIEARFAISFAQLYSWNPESQY